MEATLLVLTVDSAFDIRVRGLRCIGHQEHDLMADCCVESGDAQTKLATSTCHVAAETVFKQYMKTVLKTVFGNSQIFETVIKQYFE